MLCSLQEVGLAPHHQVLQSRVWVSIHDDEIFVGPNLQAHQHDADVDEAVQLQAEKSKCSETNRSDYVSNCTQLGTNIPYQCDSRHREYATWYRLDTVCTAKGGKKNKVKMSR